ncbi:hypothetical protein ACHAWO_007104 [Cyclotella atomus]|uniref:quinolinate synthase n=1 Tax=Cyclotella atomus TaxID=382360 RepID=A0ABD3QKQ4_9STRA
MLLRTAAKRLAAPARVINMNATGGYNICRASTAALSEGLLRRTASNRDMSSVPIAPPAQQIGAFPSLLIGPSGSLTPLGSFAEAQAAFLEPPVEVVEQLLADLLRLKIGIVAHYYMDVELQGVLHSVRRRQLQLHQQGAPGVPSTPLVAIADSLKMGDDATAMCRHADVTSVICLGVDFMSESVNAILNRNGFAHVPVYRAAQRHIGCSLAESAETDGYRAWLAKSSSSHNKSLHVVYINTSLETKAISSSILPTITCTSSNVLQTILQASAQLGPESLQICYGPDTYMGENLISLLDAVSSWEDARIASELHPQHNRESIRALRNNINVYPSGNCVVHHMFGQSVVDTVNSQYGDAYVTAHLEVPGEMFQIALQKSLRDEGVVGSTSNILNFIERKVQEAASGGNSNNYSNSNNTLKFILGTEAGMVTSIVRSVQSILDNSPNNNESNNNVQVEIIFPVSSEAVMGVDNDDSTSSSTTKLEVVPGVSGGEGCSTAGGCATCPFMKMNDLEAVQDIVEMISSSSDQQQPSLRLSKHLPPNRLEGKKIGGRDAIELGVEPIVYMREFMKSKVLSEDLVRRIEAGGSGGGSSLS